MLSPTIRKAPNRKRKSISPEQIKEYVEEENIVGYPIDISNVSVSCSRTYCAAVTATKNVVIWGDSDLNFKRKPIPREANNVQQIATGDDWIVALKEDGSLVSWGMTGFEDLRAPNLKNVIKIVACRNNFLALLEDGTIRAWGESEDIQSIPETIFDSPIEDISVGFNHAVALNNKGRVIVWGDLGNVQFPKITSKILSVKSFESSNLALQENGQLLYWGTTEYGQQIFPEGLKDEIVTSYSVGNAHCAAITESGKFFTWGWNVAPGKQFIENIIYVGRSQIKQAPVRVDINEKKYFIEAPKDAFMVEDEVPIRVYCGYDVTFVLMNSGDVIAWGDKKYDLLDIPEVIPALKRLNQPNIDMRKFGIDLYVDDIIQKRFTPKMSLVNTMKEEKGYFITPKATYKIGKFLGEGSYGKVYSATKDGKEVAAKFFRLYEEGDRMKSFSQRILEGVIQETTVQVILQEENKRLNPGFRVCGDIYELAIDPRQMSICIFQEKLDAPFDNYIKETRPSDKIFADLMIQMANKLNWLYDNLEYNHRDFKSDNAMVKFISSNKEVAPEFLLIDFGFSCLTYRGIRIKVQAGYFTDEKCFQETRDITFMLYSIYRRAKYLSPEMQKTLHSMLRFKVKGKTCDIALDNCPLEKSKTITNWIHDVYDILNLDYVYNPNATTDALIERMTPYLKESY